MEETKTVVNETTQENAGAGEIMTFDEILQDKHYQSEFDKKVAKALETARTKWEKEAEVKKTEAEKLAKMDAEEKLKYERDKIIEERDNALSRLNAYELEKEAIKIANEKGVPITFLKAINFSTTKAEDLKEIIEGFEAIYKQSVQDGINEKMKEKTPKTVVDTATKTNVSRASY